MRPLQSSRRGLLCITALVSALCLTACPDPSDSVPWPAAFDGCLVGADSGPLGGPCGPNGRGRYQGACIDEAWEPEAACVDADRCRDGARQRQICGLNGRGSRLADCVQGQWSDFTACSEQSECVDDAKQVQACAYDDDFVYGDRERVCALGRWLDLSPCDDPRECQAGAVDDVACVAPLDGAATRLCVDGFWGQFGICFDDDATCAHNEVQTFPCGLNHEGIIKRVCEGGRWQLGACEAADAVCVNGAQRRRRCGLNGNGRAAEFCIEGRWDTSAECDDPDLCVNGDVRFEDCLNGEDGRRSQRCIEGRYSALSACVFSPACAADGDCPGGHECLSDACVAPTCEDGRANGNETGVDCGGTCVACAACADQESGCNGLDDDCDGRVDEHPEGWVENAPCQAGDCAAVGLARCDDQGLFCDLGGLDSCNGLDDDCDALVDEDGHRACATALANVAAAECVAGQCENLRCEEGYRDADNQVRTGCETRACRYDELAPADLAQINMACEAETVSRTNPTLACGCRGVLSCDDDHLVPPVLACEVRRVDGGLSPFVAPILDARTCPQQAVVGGQRERCNGVDDDCDGRVDETFPIGLRCSVCADGGDNQGGVWTCDSEEQATCLITPGQVVPPAVERCNGLDDDCDGLVDEAEAADACRAAFTSSPFAGDALCHDGICRPIPCPPDRLNRDADISNGCESPACVGAPDAATLGAPCGLPMYDDGGRCLCPGVQACELTGSQEVPVESVQCRVLLVDDIVFDLSLEDPDLAPRWTRCEARTASWGIGEDDPTDGVDDDCDGRIDE